MNIGVKAPATMATNKKSKTKKSATKTPAVVAKQAPKDPKLQRLSPSQFAGVLFLALGFVYLVEYSRALQEGAGSLACANYINQGDEYKCTELDVAMIRAKYYGGISTFLSIFLTMLLCWTEEHLFLRLNSFLCLSPLLSTMWALFTTRFILGRGVVKIFMMTCVLFVLAFAGARSASTLAQPKPLAATFQEVALLSLLLVNCKEAFLLLLNGVEGYMQVSEEGISSAAEVLVPFVAVDKLTLAVLMAFVLFFFDENRKRSMLMFLAVVQLVHWYFHLPKMYDDLVDASTVNSVLLGSAVVAGAAAFVPKLTWMK